MQLSLAVFTYLAGSAAAAAPSFTIANDQFMKDGKAHVIKVFRRRLSFLICNAIFVSENCPL
jgi:hypothetical protein